MEEGPRLITCRTCNKTRPVSTFRWHHCLNRRKRTRGGQAGAQAGGGQAVAQAGAHAVGVAEGSVSHAGSFRQPEQAKRRRSGSNDYDGYEGSDHRDFERDSASEHAERMAALMEMLVAAQAEAAAATRYVEVLEQYLELERQMRVAGAVTPGSRGAQGVA